MSATTGAVAIIMASQKRVIAAFRDQGAESPDRAVPFQPQRAIDGRQFRKLVNEGVLKEAGAGLHYLDNDALAALKARRRTQVLAVLLVLIALLAAVWLIQPR